MSFNITIMRSLLVYDKAIIITTKHTLQGKNTVDSRFLNVISCKIITIIIVKNIRYILWNRGDWCSLNNTYQTFLALCIRYTDHLWDSRDLSDINQHFIPSLLPMISKCSPIATSSTHKTAAGDCDVTMTDYFRGFLWTLSYHNGVSDLRNL